MGKVRAKTIGDETAEKKEAIKAAKRKEAKKLTTSNAEPIEPKVSQEATSEEPKTSVIKETPLKSTGEKKKMIKKSSGSKGPDRSKKYVSVASLVEKSKLYQLPEALQLVEKIHLASFDETVELHVNTTGSLSGSVTLPHGSGKSIRVAILAPSTDASAADELLKKIESGKIEFDVLIATPDAMPRLAKVARILGPKGLMPNPKSGTVTTKPEEVAKQYAGGHVTFKTETVSPVLHLSVGKLSFGQEKLAQNIQAMLKAIEYKNIKNVTLKSTMSPAIRLAI